MSQRYSCADPDELEAGLKAAVTATREGALVVLPTDTVYGLGCDAFDHAAVRDLLSVKGRGREMPPPVLISARTTLDALAVGVPEAARSLTEKFWPGPLTLICRQQQTLQWDLGDTRGTVALRMPDHPVALSLLARTGPLAVSSANRTGMAAATSVEEAEDMLGESVEVYLDDGPVTGGVPSTIVDMTGTVPRMLRAGALSLEELRDVAPDVLDED
ncbi:MAG: L-threonylcarbamoyladenylate synthase [Actinomycetota bacterium]|nr:L-threonylcarbamoyladenylate synthase [Actinomycetota bacterium]